MTEQQASPKHHVIITGTGRAGTTLLMEILTHLGLDTGYTPESLASFKSSVAQAGLEKRLYHVDAPYIVKQPEINDTLPQLLRGKRVVIDHAFVPMRSLGAAAESRRRVTRIAFKKSGLVNKIKYRLGLNKHFDGGIMTDTQYSAPFSQQEEILSKRLYQTLLTLSQYSVPITLLHYPTLVGDKAYLYGKLLPIIQHIDQQRFDRVFDRIVDSSLVHTF